tara:strand:- start:290 stop:559 length:270 start_codon:yes stop_codon:yes gene_type:complete
MYLLKKLFAEIELQVKLISVVFLLTIGTLLASCDTVPIYDDLAWLEPIEFSQDTKDWLTSHGPWPEYVRYDLNKIAVLNETIIAIKTPQ